MEVKGARAFMGSGGEMKRRKGRREGMLYGNFERIRNTLTSSARNMHVYSRSFLLFPCIYAFASSLTKVINEGFTGKPKH